MDARSGRGVGDENLAVVAGDETAAGDPAQELVVDRIVSAAP
jgi:hypothetical protein